MSFLEYVKVILIGIVEGLTEWLPVSSTGHMILVENLFPVESMGEEFYGMFLYVIQFAAILAVLVCFFERLNPFSRKKNEEERKSTWRIWRNVLIGVIPAGVIGLLLDDFVEETVVKSAYGNFVVAGALIFYGILFILIERLNRKRVAREEKTEDLSPKSALLVGLFQCLSIIPGTSRSGSTVLGGMTLGIPRSTAAEYSFFMAIPIMAGVSLLKVGKFALRAMEGVAGYTCSLDEVLLLLVGSLVSFLVSMLAIRFLMDFVRRHSFEVFGWYRIILGILVILYFGFLA